MTGSYAEISMPDGQFMPAYLVQASDGKKRAGLVILQEIFGVNANMRFTAQAFASLGYDVIVPDLFWRQEPRVELDPASAADRERATALMHGLDQIQAIDDAMAAVRYLRESTGTSGKIGAVGYCLGGKLAFLLATRPEISAAVSYYGVAIESVLDRAGELCAPVLLHIGVDDPLCRPEVQQAIHQALDARENVEIIDHPGVGHAFARRGGATFNQEATERADSATSGFLLRLLTDQNPV